MGEGLSDRKQWIEARLQKLSENFAIAIGGFAILDNHLHVLARLDPNLADAWTPEEVVRRWLQVYPPRKLDLENEKAVSACVEAITQNAERVQTLRKRLASLSWFMKSLKEPLSRLANKEDDCKGTFWKRPSLNCPLLNWPSIDSAREIALSA